MKRLHLWAGVAALLAFLLSGQYMDYLEVRTNALGETARVMFRSRHISRCRRSSSSQPGLCCTR